MTNAIDEVGDISSIVIPSNRCAEIKGLCNQIHHLSSKLLSNLAIVIREKQLSD